MTVTANKSKLITLFFTVIYIFCGCEAGQVESLRPKTNDALDQMFEVPWNTDQSLIGNNWKQTLKDIVSGKTIKPPKEIMEQKVLEKRSYREELDEVKLWYKEQKGSRANLPSSRERREQLARGETLGSGSPKVGQEEDYEGYTVMKKPFTSTDTYNYVDAFFLGLKLDEFFEYSDTCLDAWVFMWDDFAYASNNMTLVKEIKETEDKDQIKQENGFSIFLNITGLIGGNLSSILPECYQLYKSAREREEDRWSRFNKDWGEFWLAFLFNQMGNALNFQAKVRNIRENTEAQNFQGVFQEYGDLVHIIYDFEPLEDASLFDSNQLVADFFKDHEDALVESTGLTPELLKTGVQFVTGQLVDNSDKINDAFNGVGEALRKIKRKVLPSPQVKPHDPPTAGPVAPYDAWPSTQQLIYGFSQGLVGVFDAGSLPRKCDGNVTTIYQTVLDFTQMGPTGDNPLNFVEEDVDLMYDIQALMKFPYGTCFSCYFTFTQVFIADDPVAEGELTEEERLRASIILVSDVVTNLMYNAGYMINDVFKAVIMDGSVDLLYWTKFGQFCGDFLIRIFWREDFITTFEY